MGRRAVWWLIAGLVAGGAAPDALVAQTEALQAAETATFPRDVVVSRVVTLADSGQQYDLYLPADDGVARSWPVLIVLDPRGRARLAMDLFLAGARDHGWIVMSSYQSRSDTDARITTRAVEALMRDAEARLAVDPRRFYLAGMSGTAFLSWSYGQMMPERIAGVIGVGAGLPRTLDAVGDVPFAYYGIAGWDDFNYQRQVDTDRQLEATPAAHRLALFAGAHGWSPEPYTRAAVDWLAYQAIRRGLAPEDQRLIDRQWVGDRARAAEAADPLVRARRLRELVRDFDGLRDVAAEKQRLARLDGTPDLRRARKQAARARAAEETYRRDLGQWFAKVRQANGPPDVHQALRDLRIVRLRKQGKAADVHTAHGAQRRIEAAYVQVAYYLPRLLQSEGDPAGALAMLEIALAIKPENWSPLFEIAGVHLRQGRRDRAVGALKRAVDLGADVAWLRDNPVWSSLHGHRGWERLVGGVPASP